MRSQSHDVLTKVVVVDWDLHCMKYLFYSTLALIFISTRHFCRQSKQTLCISKVLTSSSLALTSQLSTIFISSTELCKTTTASFNQSVTAIKPTNFVFISIVFHTDTQLHTHTFFVDSISTSKSTLIATTTPMFSFMTKSLSHSMMSVTYSLMLTKSLN